MAVINLRHSIILQNQIKRAIHTLSKQIISEIDKDKELNICKRGFEITCIDGKKYQIILEVREKEF